MSESNILDECIRMLTSIDPDTNEPFACMADINVSTCSLGKGMGEYTNCNQCSFYNLKTQSKAAKQLEELKPYLEMINLVSESDG